MNNTFNGQSPVSENNPEESDYLVPGVEELAIGGEGFALAIDPHLDRVVDSQAGEPGQRRQGQDGGGDSPAPGVAIEMGDEVQV